ncbi:MAG TPA: 50S ribosomal protein L6, partial [Acidimicrobiales bacterium]|nr:50S ribosomal protein L6 [Acidimicrobiales bacterium]
MSRIGQSPILVPESVTVAVEAGVVTVTGPNGTLTRALPDGITVERDADHLAVGRATDETSHKALHGLTRTLVANMVTGVTAGWTKEL